ncbi:MAG: MMPL family transporter [Microscillaceae bacterium]|jgi:hypothetical protein|nr:MMPL family transporter [Microscillaceae bacterium]
MWIKISHAILQYRLVILLGLVGLTAYFAYLSRYSELSYDYTSAVPSDDPELLYFNQFKKLFGDDGTVMAIGLKDKKAFELAHFQALKQLSQAIAKLSGVTQVLALPQLQYLEKDTTQKRFVAKALFPTALASQKQLDTLLQKAYQQKFYENLLFNPKNGATLILATIDKRILDSPARSQLLKNILALGADFKEKTGIELYYGGLPHIRSVVAGYVQVELRQLLVLSGIATALILFFFFRSLVAIIVPLLVIATVVVWSLGIMVLLNYKLTLLTGLLPPILVVIGIPNCIYLLTKYHQEYQRTRVKLVALAHIIQKIGLVTFMTNITTAIGFGVFVFTDNVIIRQFGVISFLSVLATFVVSLLLFPILYSYLPAPSARHTRHLDRKPLQKMLAFLETAVFNYKSAIYIIVIALAVVSLAGVWQIKAVSYMLDNVPNHSKPKSDLQFFEQNFNGLMPLEILVDTKKKKGVMSLQNLRKVDELEQKLAETQLIGRPISIVNLTKGATQAYYNNNPEFYNLPSNRDRVFILNYLQGGQDTTGARLLRTMVDSTGQKMRISLKVADVGSMRLDSLINQVIKPKIAEVFGGTKTEATVTGTTLIFIKGNIYLIRSLESSLMLAVVLIGLIMATLFGSFRMILISIMTNLLPLIITAGMMGYFNIPLKPSTALIFSIAFGIAVDDSIHYLARYRQELKLHNYHVPTAVRIALHETGTGMFYTSIVLFCGFIVFVYSDFEGTLVLGSLTATTLLVAMVGNLVLLPALLLTFDDGRYAKKSQWIDYYDENFHFEADDEELDISLIKKASASSADNGEF